MIDVVVAGHICLDLIPRFLASAGDDLEAYVAPGRLTEVGPLALSTGGAVSNTGINLHLLGANTRLMGKIGDDLIGRAVLEMIARYSEALAEGMIVVPEATSSYTIVINPPGVDRAFLHCPGANHTFGADDLRYDVIRQSRLFHFGYPPLLQRMYGDGGGELLTMFRRAKEAGATTSLDLAMPDPAGPSGQVDWRAILRSTLSQVDLFVPSVEELLFMLDRRQFEALEARVGAARMLERIEIETVRRLATEALAWGAKIIVLKLGTRGIYLRTAAHLLPMGRGTPQNLDRWAGREMWTPPFRPRQVASTVGAGDAAIAGFLAAWCRSETPARALQMAAAAGASCVEEAGAVRGVESWEATVQRIASGWEHLTTAAPGPGWQWDAGTGIWRGPQDADYRGSSR